MNNYEHEIGPIPDSPETPVWDIVFRRKWLILFWVIVGVGLAYLVHMQKPVFYQSQAQIWVSQKKASVLPGDQSQSYEDKASMRTQELLLKSPLVIQNALDAPEASRFLDRLGENPLVSISKNLTVKEVESPSNVLELTYLGSHDGDSQKVLDSVITSYQDYLGDTRENIGEETRTLITQAKDELLLQIRELEASYREFKQESPLLWDDGKGRNYFQDRLRSIEQDRSQIVVERKKLEAQLQSIQEAIDDGKSREAILLMAGESLEKEVGEVGTHKFAPLQHLLPLYVERQELMQMYGNDHPKVVAINKRVDLTREFIREMDSEGTEEGEEPQSFLDVYISFLEGQIRQSNLREKLLTELFQDFHSQGKSLTQFESQDEAYRTEISRLRQLFDTVVKRVEELSLIKDTGGYQVSVLHTPSHDIAVQLHLPLTLALGGVIGMLLGYGLAYLIDGTTQTFYSSEEVSRKLQLPLIGHVPTITPSQQRKARKRSQLDPMLYTHAIPKATISEAFRAVRTALYFSANGEDNRVVQITSPTPGDGKSTLASNLAVTIAQSGKRTLLVDADFRKPRIHTIFRIENDIGLASVIDERAELNDAIQDSGVANLSVLTCGPRPSNPSELLSSPRFQELVSVLREKFDYVIVDTPPVLAVTDPSTVAPRVDSVIMALRIRKGSRPNAERASEMLRSMGANLLGIVINHVGKNASYRNTSNGYYGGYGGYGGRNGAGYGSSNGYYGEEEDVREEKLQPQLLNGHRLQENPTRR